VRPSLDFSVITFALFKAGLVPVFIDPGMGRKSLLRACAEVKPRGMVAERRAFIAKLLYPRAFQSVECALSVPRLLRRLKDVPEDQVLHEPRPGETAAILFTSGGTGTPKGVVTTHEILHAQTRLLQEMFQLGPADTDMPGFPLFALFTLAMGMTSVVPDMDPTAPANCDPAKLVATLIDQRVSFAAGSPAIWERVGQHCRQHGITLPYLKSVVMFGAPVRGEIHQLWGPILPHGTTYAPYGATECLPIAFARGIELLRHWEGNRRGEGICLGPIVPGMSVVIDKDADIPDGFPAEVGEILVSGPTVTPGYFNRPDATAAAKMTGPKGLTHRMGDVGYLRDGQLWFCGRQAHVVVSADASFYPIPVEGVFNAHPDVKRSALVAVKQDDRTVPGLVVELTRERVWSELERELRALGAAHAHTRAVNHFWRHHGFPVDVRHNIKIDRVALSRWVKEQA
jgi:acyl-CoA synthetase (AMP-forming)/AMP-acid ligase II